MSDLNDWSVDSLRDLADCQVEEGLNLRGIPFPPATDPRVSWRD